MPLFIDAGLTYAQAARGVDPDVYLILEHFADNDEEKKLSSMGFMIWGNSNYDHRGAMAGDLSKTFNWANAEAGRGWGEKHLVAGVVTALQRRIPARDANARKSGLNRSRMMQVEFEGTLKDLAGRRKSD